jgi:hypothetical protein
MQDTGFMMQDETPQALARPDGSRLESRSHSFDPGS